MGFRFKALCTVVFVVCSFSRADAADYQGYVNSIMASGGKVFVVLNNGAGNGLCNATARFYLDPTTACDSAMLALAITAKTAGSLVYVGAADTCVSGWPYYDSQQLTTISVMKWHELLDWRIT